ncbi:hypothetical protein [Streptomyces sp. NPDC001843]|uniref:hypothetical protein n=1 Tax=Streptomyces sp. NPDC001843 TaxID=3364617 RepID=UPI00368826D7
MDGAVVHLREALHALGAGRMKGNPSISRADVADFLYKAPHSREWIHRDAVITG